MLLSPQHERGKKVNTPFFSLNCCRIIFFRKTSEFTVRPKIPFLTFPKRIEVEWQDCLSSKVRLDFWGSGFWQMAKPSVCPVQQSQSPPAPDLPPKCPVGGFCRPSEVQLGTCCFSRHSEGRSPGRHVHVRGGPSEAFSPTVKGRDHQSLGKTRAEQFHWGPVLKEGGLVYGHGGSL